MASLRTGEGASGGEGTFISRLVQLVRQLLASERTWVIGLLAFEVFGCIAIILKVPYTKIDWDAYMQEVRGFLVDGETDYLNLRGETGPLVYPGGFVWIFSALYYMTDEGINVRRAQWLFAVLYLLTLGLGLALYLRTKKTPLPALVLLVLSKRVHSIFVLRMFNDCVAMAFLYAATLCFTLQQWWVGCALYSLGVSVKMNLFLFAPGLFLLLLQAHGLWRAVMYIAWCGVIQVVVGMPFLALHPVSYLSKAFELGRVFEFKWTVNWAFLPPDVFVSKGLSLLLLVLTAVAMCGFAYKWVTQGGAAARVKLASGVGPLTADYIVTTLFVSNFVGIVFARTLHYQFYCWYFHTLPYLLWQSSCLPLVAKVAVMAAIEWAFNVFPATPTSSAVLQCAHVLLLTALALSPLPPLAISSKASKGTQDAGTDEVEVDVPEGRRITRSLAAAQKKVQ